MAVQIQEQPWRFWKPQREEHRMPDRIPEITHLEALERWRAAPKLVFFCGSAISLFPPSRLPTGWDLVSAVCDSLSGQLREAFPSAPRVPELSRLPLETLLGFALEETPTSGAVRAEMAFYFSDVPPNAIHELLAEFLGSHPTAT